MDVSRLGHRYPFGMCKERNLAVLCWVPVPGNTRHHRVTLTWVCHM